jgi:hypothetical protein
MQPNTTQLGFAALRKQYRAAWRPGVTDRVLRDAAIYCALSQANGNKSMAAELLGITEKSVYNRLAVLRIDFNGKAWPEYGPALFDAVKHGLEPWPQTGVDA